MTEAEKLLLKNPADANLGRDNATGCQEVVEQRPNGMGNGAERSVKEKTGLNWYLECWKKYAVFSGRARRREYWMFVLWNMLAWLGLGILSCGVLNPLYALAALLPSLAVNVRRLHDSNRSGWWLLLSLVPFVGPVWLLVLMVLGGTRGANRYGEDPKGGK